MAAPALVLEHESPLIRRLPNGEYRLEEAFRLWVDGRELVIPAGATTDFSSVPWAVAWMADREKHDLAGIVHDFLFRFGTWGEDGAAVTRAQADRIWRLVGQAGETSLNGLQAWVMWVGLRLGSWVPWRRYRRAS